MGEGKREISWTEIGLRPRKRRVSAKDWEPSSRGRRGFPPSLGKKTMREKHRRGENLVRISESEPG